MSNRPTAWLGGVGLGLCLVCAFGLLAVGLRLTVSAGVYVWIFLGGVGLAVAADFAAGGVVWWRHEGTAIEAERERNKASAAATAERLAKLAVQMVADTDDDEVPAPHRATAVGVLRFFTAGNALGFALDGLAAADVLTQPTWQRLKDFYLCWPADSPVLVDRGGNVGTVWAPTWTLGKVGEWLATGELPLPLGAPPVVGIYVAPKHNANTRRNTAAEVVEGVIIKAGKG